jgi:hypothetical protein
MYPCTLIVKAHLHLRWAKNPKLRRLQRWWKSREGFQVKHISHVRSKQWIPMWGIVRWTKSQLWCKSQVTRLKFWQCLENDNKRSASESKQNIDQEFPAFQASWSKCGMSQWNMGRPIGPSDNSTIVSVLGWHHIIQAVSKHVPVKLLGTRFTNAISCFEPVPQGHFLSS